MFGRKPRAGLAIMNLGELEDGISAEEQLLEVLGDKNKEEVQATLVKCRVTLGRTDNTDNASLNIIFSCDKDESQTLEGLEAQKNSHLVEIGTKEANSCFKW